MMSRTSSKFVASQDLQLASARSDLVKESKLHLAQSLRRSQPLTRWSLWPMEEIP